MKVARSELTFSTPIFAKIAVSAANTADSTAHTCHDSKFIPRPFVMDGRPGAPFRPILKCEQHRGVPGILIGLVGVLDAAPDIAEQMVVVAEIVAPSDAEAGGRGRAARIRGLVKQLGAKLELGQKLIGQDRAGLTEIDRAEFGDRASAAA